MGHTLSRLSSVHHASLRDLPPVSFERGAQTHSWRRAIPGFLLLWAALASGPLLADPVGVFEEAVDVGAPPAAGSTTFDGATYTLSGSGADIWDGGDQFHFAYRQVFGDFRATMRVTSRSTLPSQSGSWGRYGLMARWSLGSSAKYSMVSCVLPTVDSPGGAVPPFYQYRLYDGFPDGNRLNYQANDSTFPAEGRQPSWFRLERLGNTLHGYLSEDADQDGAPDRWCLIGSDPLNFPRGPLLVGVALHSQSGANLGTITFDNVVIEHLSPPAPLDCGVGDLFAAEDFSTGLGSTAYVAGRWTTFTPRVQGGRLTLTEDGTLSAAAAVWYDYAGSSELSASGFVAEFDAFMSRTGPAGTDLNPADGLTFSVVDGGRDILNACPDRSDPHPARFATSTLVSAGAGCAPAVVTSTLRDLVPGQTSLSAVQSEGDIWAGGDTFHFQYSSVSGDFDLAIELRDYAHSNGAGEWGKFGLMARQSLASTSRFTMTQAHGPSLADPARQAGRVNHLDAGGPPALYESIFPNVGARPRFLRLTRRGNVFQGWVSDNPGLADGTLNACNDCNWIPGVPDDWGAGAPATVLLGFANSNHNSAGCATQTVAYVGLPACHASAAFTSDLVGAPGGALGYGGGTLLERTECHPSFAIELDNWVGGGEPGNEPSDGGAPSFDFNYHVGLDVNANVSSLQTNVDHGIPTGLLPPIFAAAGVHVRVVATPDGLVEAYVRSNTPPSVEYQVLSSRLPPLQGELLFGFTAGTGAATARHQIDNFTVRRLGCSPSSSPDPRPVLIDLGNITGGGDGRRDSAAPFAGVDQRTGTFVAAGLDSRVNDSDASYLAPGPSPYIDSVFYLARPAVGGPAQSITQSNVKFTFPAADVTNSGWNFVLRDRVGGISAPGIVVGPFTGLTTSVGIHSAMGITYDLDALRAQHGARNVECFSTLWGLDSCATGDVNLYAILSSSSGILTQRSFRATAGGWQILQLPIPTAARYLTLATGSNGGDNCDHGTFGRPLITSLPCPSFSSITWLWDVLPRLISPEGGTNLTLVGEELNPFDTYRVGGRELTNLFAIGPTIITGDAPPLEPGFHDVEILNSDGFLSAVLPNAIEVVPAPVIFSVEPPQAFRDEETAVTIHGANFRSSTRVSVEVIPGEDAFPLLDPIFVSDTTITGRVPALPGGQPNGFRRIHAVDTHGTAILDPGVEYIDASGLRLTSVAPNLLSTLGGTRVTFSGQGFSPGIMTPRIGGVPMSDVVFLDASTVEGSSPPLAAGTHAAELVRAGGEILVTLPGAFTVAPPVQLTSVNPTSVFTDGSTQVTVSGANFRAETTILIGGRELVGPVVAPGGLTITGRAPALDIGEPAGSRDVEAVDPRGTAVLPAGVTYVSPPAVSIASVAPGLVSTAGGTQVTFTGAGFRAGAHVPRLGGRPLSNVTFVSATQLRGSSPALPAGLHAAEIASTAGGVLATRANAVEAAAPVTLLGVEPRVVFSDGTSSVLVRGSGFRAATTIRFGARDLVSPVVAPDGATISGKAPALGAGEVPGDRDVTAVDPRGTVTLVRGVTYVPPPPAAPGPEEIEASLAEGTARFRWVNPVQYSKILVTDLSDRLIAELPGDSTFLELPALGKERLDVRFKGIVREDTSAPSDASAMRHECERPPPLLWGGAPGDLNMTLYGANNKSDLARCAAGGGGGGGEEAAGVDDGAGGAAPLDVGGGGLLFAKSVGWMVQQEFVLSKLVQKPTQLVTGFVLEEPADKLEIAGFYEKLATAFDLELHMRLIHVFPDDGFVDDFTLPDVLINQGKALNCITYFRADKDIGKPGDPDAVDPADQPPKSCGLQIPEGEYLLEIYAKGGDRQIPYYIFGDDPHDDELLIAGSPCPPYPLVKVTDLTGLRTLPDLTKVEVTEESFRTPVCVEGNIFRRLNALGVWLDELNQSHDVQTDSSPHFEYIWKVHDRPIPRTIGTFGRPYLNYCFLDYGCYKVDITVRDRQCGFEKTRSFEVPIVPGPSEVSCPAPFTFLFPAPDPAGTYAVVGLRAPNAPGGQGTFSGKRPLSLRVLVVPQCYCADSDPTDCPGAVLGPNDNTDTDDPIQFRLAFKTSNGGRQKVEGVTLRVKDLCPNVPYGAKYFLLEVDDLGTIPPQSGWEQLKFYDIFIQGRARPGNNDPTLGWRDVGEQKARPLHLGNRPQSLTNTFWNGHFIEEDQSYHFTTTSQRSPQANLPIGASKAVDLGLPGVDVGIPSFDNDLASGFTARFGMLNGLWFSETGSGASSGNIMGNAMNGAPVQVKSAGGGGGVGGAGGWLLRDGEGAGGALPTYEWCDHRKIVDEHFSQTLFESILYTGTIGPIPVTIWASIGFGLDILVEAYTTVKVTPFQGLLEGGSFAETHFYLLSTTNLAIPCELRADIVGGIISIAMRLIPSAEFRLDTHIWSRDVQPHADLFVKATLDLVMEIEGCLNLILTKICVGTTIPILDDEPILDPIGTDPRPPITCSGGGGGEPIAEPDGGAAGIFKFDLPYQSISAPVTVVSPDRLSRMELTFDQDGISKVVVNSEPAETPTFPITVGDLMNPAATFVSNTAGIIAWTKSFCADAGLGALCNPQEGDPAPTPAQENVMYAQQEIVLSTLKKTKPANPLEFPKWVLADTIRIADPPSEVPNPAARHADGMAAVAADLSTLSDDPPGGEALVTWVRYEGDFQVLDGKRKIFRKLPKGQTVLCPSGNPQAPFKQCDFVEEEVDNYRPQMELTAIYARRVGLNGLLVGEDKVKLSPPGINVEPAVALSPTGNVGYCIWVHDPTHKNLIDTNRGRSLLYSVYNGATGAWSAPASILANLPDYDAKYPGVLEPHMALRNDTTGLLVFTALAGGASTTDSGLGGSRYVYGVRLTGGVFGEPFLIHGRCLRRQYGWIPQVIYDIPDLVDPLAKLKFRQPEWVMVFQGTGPIGQEEGSGNVVVSVIPQGVDQASPAVGLFNDGAIRSNVSASLAGGVLHTLNLNTGPGKILAGGGAGGGAEPRVRFFESTETRLEPDLAVIGCTISDPYPAPGSRVTTRVLLENLGFAGTPVDELGASAVGLEAVFIEEDGSERVVGFAEVPELQPSLRHTVELPLEMPHDPVRLRVRLNPNPIDRDHTNDFKDCFFGAPSPREVDCVRTTLEDEAGTQAVALSWSSPVVYDEVIIYRGGSMLAALPGGCTRYVDLYAPPGSVEYAVRGRVGASKSARATILCGGFGEAFLRGDTDANGALQITDAISLLGYLFLGGREPLCQDASDTDDNGQLQITDAVRLLGYLFLGGTEPPAPFPGCGLDPTEDGLPCTVQPGCR